METFNEFIDELLTQMNPYDPETHPPNSVIILDNCRIHKDPDMIRMVLEQYAQHTVSMTRTDQALAGCGSNFSLHTHQT